MSWQNDFINNFIATIYAPCIHNKQGMCKNERCDQYSEFVDAQFCRAVCPQYEREMREDSCGEMETD